MRRILRIRFIILLALSVALLISLAVIVNAIAHSTPASLGVPAGPEETDTVASAMRVTTIHPKKDAAFTLSIQQLAIVKAYFMVELKTRVAGVVKSVRTDIGSLVKKGDTLIEIDVPDLEKEILQKRATVEQRKQEFRMAQAKVKSAQAFVDVARTTIAQQQAGILQATATRDYRKKRLDRYRELLKRQAINEDLVDEQEQDWIASQGALEFAKASVEKAGADVKEKQANLETALVDVDLKKSQIDVAQHDLERSEALADYATIRAPFDGAITKRNVDPGNFVQNSSTGNTEALLSLARIDVVTVVAKVPDNSAPFVSKSTEVEIQVDQLPGTSIKAKVTRFSPSIDGSDRTMRVEVDLLNSKEICRDDLRSGTEACCDANVVQDSLGENRLLPGMNGYMRLKLNDLTDAYLVPSNTVFSRGGKQYVMRADQGHAKLIPVFVQVNDGKLARIVLIERDSAGRTTLMDLTGKEEFIASRQSELDDGQPIQANLQRW